MIRKKFKVVVDKVIAEYLKDFGLPFICTQTGISSILTDSFCNLAKDYHLDDFTYFDAAGVVNYVNSVLLKKENERIRELLANESSDIDG